MGIFFSALLWCERRDLNPYGITTRPSNVRVCRFRHSRIFCFAAFATVIIIAKVRFSVKRFLQNMEQAFYAGFADGFLKSKAPSFGIRRVIKIQKCVWGDAEGAAQRRKLNIRDEPLAALHALYGIFIHIQPHELQTVGEHSLAHIGGLRTAQFCDFLPQRLLRPSALLFLNIKSSLLTFSTCQHEYFMLEYGKK